MHERASEHADQYDRHWCAQAFGHERPQYVVQQIHWHHVKCKQNRRCRIHHKPAPDDQRQQDDRRANLNYSKHQN